MNHDIDKVLHSIHPDYRKCTDCGEYFFIGKKMETISDVTFYLSQSYQLCPKCFRKFLNDLEGKDYGS